ncbi:MAG: response regulator [Pseudomonadota bacterium]|nr:response regulator [Pseudomonadota bacterium]
MLSAKRHCVLLVEDPAMPVSAVDQVFVELGQPLVRVAGAAAALACARASDFALILIGVQGDGAEQLDLLRQLGGIPRASQSALIVLAPHADAAFPLERCYAAGAIDVLVGPLAPAVLKAKARFFVAAAHSAAERRSAEAALKDTRGRLDSTVAAAELAMWSWDIRHDRVSADAATAWLFNVSPEIAAGGPISAFHAALHPGDAARDAASIRRAIDTGEAYESKLRVRAADGQYHAIVSHGQMLYDSEGRPEQLRGVIVDVTAEQHARAELRDSEARYRSLFDAIDEGVCIIEMLYDDAGRPVDYRFIEMNDAFVQHTGLPDAVGKTILQMIPGHDQHWIDLYGKVAATGVPVRTVDEARAMGRWFDVYATRVGDADSARVAVLFTDITERRRAETQLQRLADDLTAADRRKTEFLATLAHELRNPLAPLRSGLQVLRLSGGEPAAAARVLDVMERQLGHMVELVDDLLDIARITRGQVELKPALIDVQAVLDAAVEAALPVMQEHCHQFRAIPVAGPLTLMADATRLTQVVSNLLNNAAKYTPRGGLVTLAARREQAEVLITVSDNGVGIAPASLEEVFGLFNQVGRELDRSQGGLGIGLSLVRSLVEQHGGSVAAHSEGAGHGSTFTVRVPLASAAAHAGAAAAAPLPAARLHATRVLVVDDNRDAAETLAALLELLGHVAQVANDGHAALAAMQEFRPQVVFLDIGMPGMNGYQVAEAIRNDRRFDQPLLVALTGWGGEEDRQRTDAAGFDQHLTKPVDLGAIERMLAAL